MAGFTYRTWGQSWASAWANSWGLGVTPVITIDRHDGERKRKQQKEARERLRSQIRMAIDGPEAPTVIAALERVAEQGPGALELRVQMDELLQQVEVWRLVQAAAAAYVRQEQDIDEDDEEVLTLQ
jgi:hypothetical protein